MQELINAKLKELTDNGKLDEIITKQTTDFINGIIKDALSSYGDVGSAYKKKLQATLLEGLDKLDFVQYSKSLIDLVEAELNKSVLSIAIEPAKEMIKSFTGELEKKHWKLSEIIEKYKQEEVIPDEHGESGEIAFIHEVSDYGTVYVSFSESSKKVDKRYQCKYRLMIDRKTNKLYSPNIDGMPTHPIKEMGGLYGFDLFLFKLYAMECTIECDVHNVETEWSTYND
jgi:hypothetical protein